MPTVRRGHATIHYEIEGKGTPIVLHTGGGGDLRMWRLAGYTRALAPKHQLILIDHRGHGQSSKPNGITSHRIEEYRDDVLAVLDAADVEEAAFLGYSVGALVGYALADARPECVSALIDLDGAKIDESETQVRDASAKLAQDARTRGLKAIIESMASAEGVPPEHPVVRNLETTDSEMFALGVEALGAWDGPLTVLERLKVPLLLILNGRREQQDPDEFVRIMSAAGGRAYVLSGLGHLKSFIESERTLPLIQRFLADLGL